MVVVDDDDDDDDDDDNNDINDNDVFLAHLSHIHRMFVVHPSIVKCLLTICFNHLLNYWVEFHQTIQE